MVDRKELLGSGTGRMTMYVCGENQDNNGDVDVERNTLYIGRWGEGIRTDELELQLYYSLQ